MSKKPETPRSGTQGEEERDNDAQRPDVVV